MDKGPSTIVTANVTMSGGTPPYTVTLYSGSTPSCASDTTKVVVSSGSNPQTGVTGTSTTFNFASQASSTYYCATVKDSAPTPATVLTSTVLFAVNPSLDTPILTISPTVLDAGQSAIVTAKVTWSGGTSPYTVTLHSGSSPNCAFDTTIVASSFKNATSASFTLASPASNTYYCATVKDSGVTPLTVSSATSLFTVNPPVSISAFFLSPLALDSGQPTTVTASVSWSGGISSYAVTLYSSPSANCGSGGTVVAVLTGFNPMTGVTKTTETFTFAPPVTTTYYCAVVTDSSSMPMTVTSAPATVVYGPEGVALNPRTGFVYVTDPLSYRISVIDSFSNTVVNTIAVGSLPWGIAVNPITNVVYVTNYGSGTVTVINGTTNKVITTITVRTGPEGIAINLALNLVYVADSGSDFVSVINATTNTVIASAPVGNNPTSVAIGPSPIYSVFVTDYGSNTVSVIQPHVDGSYGVTPVAVGGSPWGVAVDNSTNRVYVTNSGSGTVSVLNGSTFATVTTITIGTGSTPEGIAINAAASMAYVANAGSNTVSVINTATNKVITSTSLLGGSIPSSVALFLSANPSLEHAYVANAGSNTVSVINIVTDMVVATIVVS
jgi:YVTN family beta-propeller protein